MRIVYVEIELIIPGVRSLKEKRRIVKGIKERVARQFDVVAREKGYRDLWQRSRLAFVTLGEYDGLQSLPGKIEEFIETYFDVNVTETVYEEIGV